MIHIATVHFQTSKWIDVQLGRLARHIREPYRVYACLNAIPEQPAGGFYFRSDKEGTHPGKLNHLAATIVSEAQSDDLLIFLDGDAFPISDGLIPFIRENIERHRLLAVRRDENNGDIQPHPSFCATTAGFWKQIGGDWEAGYCWKNAGGEEVTDSGGNLLKILQDLEIDWLPLLRTNTKNLHPVWFGVYAGRVYHHGAGFRSPLSRFDLSANRWVAQAFRLARRRPDSGAFSDRCLRAAGRAALGLFDKRPTALMERVFSRILTDPDFHLEFTGAPSGAGGDAAARTPTAAAPGRGARPDRIPAVKR